MTKKLLPHAWTCGSIPFLVPAVRGGDGPRNASPAFWTLFGWVPDQWTMFCTFSLKTRLRQLLGCCRHAMTGGIPPPPWADVALTLMHGDIKFYRIHTSPLFNLMDGWTLTERWLRLPAPADIRALFNLLPLFAWYHFALPAKVFYLYYINCPRAFWQSTLCVEPRPSLSRLVYRELCQRGFPHLL